MGLNSLGILSYSRFISVFLHEMTEPLYFQIIIKELIKTNEEKTKQIS